MSYTVLARRYRSKDFDDLVGQEVVAQTLKHAIESGRVAHAYLFCGTRGVGKTSLARILAKALNCEKGPTVKPCNTCERCAAISAGDDIDVVEIDGASNRGIEEIRNLRSNAIYRPARSPYKIYIIDEVHMLTKEAFNALLKTLEEPPSHVKFIFATTESHRVPETISSRCQEFHFRLIPTAVIAERLADILKAEKVKAPADVVGRIARAGRGSMRDALSLADQLLAQGADRITGDMVEQVLGEPATEQLIALADAFAAADPGGAIRAADALLASGYAPEQFVVALIEHLRRLMLIAVVGKDTELVDVAGGEREPLAAQAPRFDPLSLVYMIQLLEQLRQSVRASTTAARALIDAAMVRLALLDRFADTAELVEQLAGDGPDAAGPGAKKKVEAASARPAPLDQPDRPPPGDDGPAAVAPQAAAAGPNDLGPPLVAPEVPLESRAGGELWGQVIGRLGQARVMSLVGPLQHTRLAGVEGDTLRVEIPGPMRRMMESDSRRGPLLAALRQLLSRPVKIDWVESDQPAGAPAAASATRNGNGADGRSPAPAADPAATLAGAGQGPSPARLSKQEMDQILADPTVRRMMEQFDATVVGVERKGHESDAAPAGPPAGGA